MKETRVPAGIVCAAVTPFAEDGSVDQAAAKDLFDFLVEKGVHSLFVLGTTGDGPILPPDERRSIAEFALEHVSGRVPVVVHTGAADTKTTAELARHAEQSGAAAAATVAPFYFAYGPEALYRHFRTVAEAASGIEHYLYDNPERIGYSIGPSTVGRLVTEVPNIVGIKDTGDSIGRLTEYLAHPGETPHIYTGNNLIIFPALSIGARGAVSALANAVPELVVAIYDAWSEGRTDECLDLQLTLTRFNTCLKGMPYAGGIKHILERRGLSGGGGRAPQSRVSPEEAAEIDRRLSSLEELEPWIEPVSGGVRVPG
jgi:4-hydroxy-tetrahydrodipicolinate synthase